MKPCAAIREVVGDRPLKEAVTRLVIPTYDVNTGKVYLFKTPHHPGCLNHADLTAVDAARRPRRRRRTSRRT